MEKEEGHILPNSFSETSTLALSFNFICKSDGSKLKRWFKKENSPQTEIRILNKILPIQIKQ